MAQGKTGKAKRATGRGRRAAQAALPGGEPRNLDSLARERDELRAELSAAQQRIAALEAQRRNAIDRIDWVIDSLQHVIESGA
jgi:hypothetical protein